VGLRGQALCLIGLGFGVWGRGVYGCSQFGWGVVLSLQCVGVRVVHTGVGYLYPLRGDGIKIDPNAVLGPYVCPAVGRMSLQGYLAYKKQRPPRTLQ